jgi:hypothetical protein
MRPAAPLGATSSTGGIIQAPQAGGLLPESVDLAALDRVSDRVDVGRNPFGYGVAPAPPAPAYTPPVPVAPAAPPVPQGPPPIALRLTGMIVMPSDGRTMVTLKDPVSGAIFQGFEGEVIDGRYRIVKVGVQSVVVAYLDGSGTRTIALGG